MKSLETVVKILRAQNTWILEKTKRYIDVKREYLFPKFNLSPFNFVDSFNRNLNYAGSYLTSNIGQFIISSHPLPSCKISHAKFNARAREREMHIYSEKQNNLERETFQRCRCNATHSSQSRVKYSRGALHPR